MTGLRFVICFPGYWQKKHYMNYRISKRAASLTASLTLAIDSKLKQMKADGQDVVGSGTGAASRIFEHATAYQATRCIKALNDGFTKYTPYAGGDP